MRDQVVAESGTRPQQQTEPSTQLVVGAQRVPQLLGTVRAGRDQTGQGAYRQVRIGSGCDADEEPVVVDSHDRPVARHRRHVGEPESRQAAVQRQPAASHGTETGEATSWAHLRASAAQSWRSCASATTS